MKSQAGFNSKVVRLKADKMRQATKLNEFQFQSGAVKSVFSGELNSPLYLFQFQSGAVKS